jgi:hypothetical protein
MVGVGHRGRDRLGRPHHDHRHPARHLDHQPTAIDLDLPPRTKHWDLGQDELGRTVVTERGRPQISWLIRGLWFVIVGWWASAIWMGFAWLIQLTVIGIPIALLMFNRTPFIASLYRY